ncbi:MAG TPA: PLP-dependent transferase [Tepidisphaeraceae bacterium]|nr:PLP-dependent transferase [Tepidisphaeraceae bacterium]
MDVSPIDSYKLLSPRRNSSAATDLDSLVAEQMQHFGIDARTEYGLTLARIARRIYETHADLNDLWRMTLQTIDSLDRSDRIAYFNAKKFLCFQLAKVIDNLQQPTRRTYQSLGYSLSSQTAKGPYSPFDNITAMFSATPVITRTATYIYACAEWIEDAFQGKEMLLEVYARFLNPTSVSLANYIVDLECGPYATDYMAWNFSSGMAAIDCILSHVLGREDIVIHARNIYGGAHQLIHDWFAKPGNLNVGVEFFDGYDAPAFEKKLAEVQGKYADRLKEGRKIYVYLESPCNPHGYVLDVPAICRSAHAHGLRVILDATVGTPFLHRPLQRKDPAERPDFVMHSYTKDISGTGSVLAGGVIGRNEDMFIPKGQSMNGVNWDQTMFWNVYYVKGGVLNADAAFEVLQGAKTLEGRMLTKVINTQVLAQFLSSHPQIRVRCNALPTDPNHKLMRQQLHLGMPAPLFTADFGEIPREVFQRFFDSLSPTFGHMISLGQSNTIVACPALTTHSELNAQQLAEAGISPTMVRIAVGDENPIDLIHHLIAAAESAIDPVLPGFSAKFPDAAKVRAIIRETYLATHQKYVESRLA